MSPWTNDRVEILTRTWSEGLSATLIARQLACGITRNAVVGKATRMKLPSRKTVTFAHRSGRLVKAKTPQPRIERVAAPVAAPTPAPIPEVIEPLTTEHKLHFMSAENHHCHWPLLDDDTPFKDKFFCGTLGADVNDRRPYCPGHSRMSVNPPMPRKPQKYWTERAA